MLCSRRHQVIVLPLMVAVSVLGCLAWWAPNGAANATPHDRIYAPNAAGERLAAVLLGELVLWDIPLTFLPTIWSPAAMAHHVCTALLALLALRPYCAYYAPFFAGAGWDRAIPHTCAREPAKRAQFCLQTASKLRPKPSNPRPNRSPPAPGVIEISLPSMPAILRHLSPQA